MINHTGLIQAFTPSLDSIPIQIPLISHIDSNDMDPSVVESMRRNIAFNGHEVSSRVHTSCSDARILMMSQAGKKVAGDWRTWEEMHTGVCAGVCGRSPCTSIRRTVHTGMHLGFMD